MLFPPFFCFAAISIHALLAESDTYAPEYRPETEISIHALLAESDVRAAHTRTLTLKFLSTLSLRRATEQSASYNAYLEISIHALLAESDSERPEIRRFDAISIHALLAESDKRETLLFACPFCISIHALLAESDMGGWRSSGIGSIFLSTLSLRRATTCTPSARPMKRFLSTLSLRRATVNKYENHQELPHFYPRSPCGERRALAWLKEHNML